MARFDVGEYVYIKDYPNEWGIIEQVLAEHEPVLIGPHYSTPGFAQRLRVRWCDGECFPAYSEYLVKA